MKPAPPVTRMFFGVYGPVSAVPVRSRLIAGGPGSISADEVEAESREGAPMRTPTDEWKLASSASELAVDCSEIRERTD